jgi:hypothetical protein
MEWQRKWKRLRWRIGKFLYLSSIDYIKQMTSNSEIIVVETVVPAAADDHFGKAQYLQSTFYEQLVEHIFVAELL